MSNQMDPKRVVTGKVRLSYAHLTKPRAAKPGDKEKFGVTMLIPKSDVATMQRIQAAIDAAIQEAIPNKWGGVCPPQPSAPIHDGDGLRQSGEAYPPECKGHWVVTASNEMKPEIVDTALNPILDATQIYSGMYAHVSVKFFGYLNSGKKGIGCSLGNVQKVADGEPLGGGTRSAAEDFGSFGQAQQQQPAYQQPTYAQPAALAYPAPALPGYAPVAPQPVYSPSPVQIDPITGKPIIGTVMGL